MSFGTIFNNPRRLCTALWQGTRGVGAITSPRPSSVYTSITLIIIPLQASLWAEWYFLFHFIFPNTPQYGIQYFFGSSGALGTNFFRKCVYAALLIPFLGCHFIYLCPYSILQMRRTASPTVEKNKTGLRSGRHLHSNRLSAAYWVDELEWATHSKIQLDHLEAG